MSGRHLERWLPAMGLLLAAAVFAGDLQLPVGVSHSLLYVIGVVLALGHPRPAFALVAASLASGLTVLGFFLSPQGGDPTLGIFNRSLAVLMFWTTAALVIRHRRIDRALAKERHEARTYLDIAAVAIVVLDHDGRVQLINRRGCELLERRPEEVLGEPWFERFVSERHRAESLASWRRVLAGEAAATERFENAIVTEGGRERQMVWRRTAMLDSDGRVVGTVSSGEDVTEQRDAEERMRRQETLAQVGQLAAVVAHQVRNPLAGIKGAIQVIGGRLPPESPDRAVVSSILDRIGALNDMTRDLLQFARPRPPRIQALRLHTVLQDAAVLLGSSPDHPAAEVSVTGAELSVPGDPEQLKDVFLNLFLNAAQAMQGRGQIRVSVSAEEGSVRVAVHDSGPGVPPENRDRLFEPFFTTKHRGTGLGLAIVKSQVEAHGGRVSVDCPAEGGTRVTVELPTSQVRGQR